MPKRMRSSSRGFKRRRPYRSASQRTHKKRRYTAAPRVQLNQPNAYRVLLQERIPVAATLSTGWNHSVFGVNDRITTMANWGQYSTMFSKYRVDSFRFSVMISQISVGSYPIRVYMWADDKSTCTTESEATKRPFVKCRLIPADNSIIRLSMRVKPWRVLGITKQHYINDDYYSASTSGSPSKLAYLHVGLQVQSGTPIISKIERVAQIYKFYNRVERT